MSPSPLIGIVLAGGLGRRMGGIDKPLALLGGRPLIGHVIERLGCARAISANGDPARFASFGLPVLPDTLPGHPGPLAGVLAGLDWAAAQGADGIVTAAADTPFFPRDCAVRLAAAAAEARVPVALATGATPDGVRRHPTFAWWAVTMRPRLREALAAGRRRVGEVAEAGGLVEVAFPGDEPFFNVNTLADLALAERRLAAGL
ncbi:molybdenum cofactor guanylyltransferase MobA [Paracoccus sp. S-4012]|uniref:molybdenum cofactor guanylyltransferase MobA n=1 Tax=Paracoccus sp. S-4012 TaxID=2665648 RepID=UPI001E55CC50|nr:molybdenum cofactor guanylyltransferase MobA [Paracoccus sp. S-4012]